MQLFLRISLAALIAAVLCARPATAEDPAPDPAIAGWSVTLERLSNETLLPDQPLKVRLTARYNGEAPFVGRLPLLGMPRTGLEIRRGDRLVHLLSVTHTWREFLGPPDDGAGVSYPRGHTQVGEFNLMYDFDAKRYLFEQPGAYEVQMGVTVFAGKTLDTAGRFSLRSNPIRVTVLPLPPHEAGALKLWDGKDQAHVLMAGSLEEREQFGMGLVALKKLVDQYPKSSYAALARAELKRLEPPAPVPFFPNDRRLDQSVVVDFPTLAPYREVLASLRRQSGLILALDPNYEQREFACLKQLIVLRKMLQQLESSTGGRWQAVGKGYRLSPPDPK